MKKQSEKRRMERFRLALPSVISVSGEEKVLDLQTSNICAGGVYFKTEQALAEGTEVKIDLIIPLDELRDLKGKNTLIRVLGKVIRTDKEGMAIGFDEDYQVMPYYDAAIPEGWDIKGISVLVSESLVHIVGPNKLQNRLLVQFFKMEIGLKSRYCTSLDMCAVTDPGHVRKHLVLFDCLEAECPRMWSVVKAGASSDSSQCFAALFNVGPENKEFEEKYMDRGFQGMFYNDDSLEQISEGVLAMLDGEFWYSRRVLSKRLSESESSRNLLGESAVLTSREKEILARIVSGETNKVIAVHFGIEVNTVKAHIYNIYRKIKVKNRLQAMLWAARHI